MHNLMDGFYSDFCYLCIYFLLRMCNASCADVQRTAALGIYLLPSECTGATGNDACVLSLLLILCVMQKQWYVYIYFLTQSITWLYLHFEKVFSHLKSWFCLNLPYREYLPDWLLSTSGELGFSRGWLGTLFFRLQLPWAHPLVLGF